MQTWVIRFENEKNRELTGLRGSVRMVADTQVEVEITADQILSRWLHENPGQVGSWTITAWVQPKYRAGRHLDQLKAKLTGDA